MQWALQALLFVTCLIATACASQDQPEIEVPDNPGLVDLKTDWYTYVGFGPSYRDYRWNLAQDDSWVYVISKQGKLYRVSKDKGHRETVTDFGREITGGVTRQHNLLLLGNIDGELIAFNLATGVQEWVTALGSEVLHPPASDGKLVAVKTNNGQLWGIELASGIIQWTTITHNPPLTTRAVSTPLLASGVVISSFDTGKVAIINPINGARMWEAQIGVAKARGEIQQINDSDTSPVLVPPYLYAANLHGSLHAFRITNIQRPMSAWSKEFSTHHNLALDDTRIYTVDDQSRIFAFSQEDGAELWSNTQLINHGLGEPFLWQGYLLYANARGYLFVFNPDNGELLGSDRVSRFAYSSALLADNERLYLLDNGGYLNALTITNNQHDE